MALDGQEGCARHKGTASCPEYPVLETKRSGVESGFVGDPALKREMYRNVYVLMLSPCSVLKHTACPGLLSR